LVADAYGNYSPFGYPSNWRDITLGLNRSPDEFGNAVRPVTHVLKADGSVDVLANDAAHEVVAALAGPPDLRPVDRDVARPAWPYRRPPGGYWRTETIARLYHDGRPSLGLSIRRDPSGDARQAWSSGYDKGHSPLDESKDLSKGALDPILPRLLEHPTIETVRIRNTVSGSALVQLRSLPQLRVLRIGGSRIADSFLASLSDFRSLEELTLSATAITDEGLASFPKTTSLRRLRIHHSAESSFTPKGVVEFWANHPQVELVLHYSGKRGEWNWYHHTWTRCEIETLAAHNQDFDDPNELAALFDCPTDALRPENVLAWRQFGWSEF
jgi:hypothetical protein